jgi:hypothetical protein
MSAGSPVITTLQLMSRLVEFASPPPRFPFPAGVVMNNIPPNSVDLGAAGKPQNRSVINVEDVFEDDSSKSDSNKIDKSTKTEPQARPKSPVSRLVKEIDIPSDYEDDETFDSNSLYEKLYPGCEVLKRGYAPDGWVAIWGISFYVALTVDYNPPTEKKVKRWIPYDRSDPNCESNLIRASLGYPPVDGYHIGVVYTYNSKTR